MITYMARKLIALILAGTISLSAANALATDKETVTVLPTTTTEEMVDEISQEEKADLMLTDEEKAFYEQFVDAKGNHFSVDDYETYLTENGIKTVDGNTIIETIDDFEKIVQFYKKYLKSNNIMLTDNQIRDYILMLNIAFIPKEVIQELANKGEITVPYAYGKTGVNAVDKIVEESTSIAKTNSPDRFILQSPTILNKNIRSCAIYAEKHLQEYIACKDKDNSYKSYTKGFYDFYLFLTGEKSTFPINISELDPSAKFTFKILASETSWINMGGGGPILMEFSNYAVDKEARDDALQAIQEYTDLIQEAPVKTK